MEKQWCTKVILCTYRLQYLDAKQFMSMNLLHANATYLRDAISIARRALVNCSCFLDRPFCARFVNCIAYLMRHLVSENRLTSPHYNKMTVFDCDIYANILRHLQCHSEFVKNSYRTKWQWHIFKVQSPCLDTFFKLFISTNFN